MSEDTALALSIPLGIAAIFVVLFAWAVPSWNAAATDQKKEDTIRIETCVENGGTWLGLNGGSCIITSE